MGRIRCGGKGQISVYDGGVLLINEGIDTRGGTYFFADRSDIQIKKEIFCFNSVSKDGGAIFLYNCESVVIEDCVFLCNRAKWGGAIYFEKCRDIVLRNNIFIWNFALRDGGAVSFSNSQMIRTSEGNLYFGNRALRSCNNIEFHHCI